MFRNKGFTLVEILIALFIFAIMGVLAAISLHSMIRVHRHLRKTDKEITSLQITMTLLRHDILEMIDRPIRGAKGENEPAFFASQHSIIFTRTGLFNPFYSAHQSNMQRVGYLLQNHELVRVTWDVLDQVSNTKPAEQILLRHVQSLQWQFMSDDGKMFSSWPPVETATQKIKKQSALPKAVLMVMHIQNDGVIQGVFPVPARGAHA